MFRVINIPTGQSVLCEGAQETLLPFHFKGKHKMVLEVVMLLFAQLLQPLEPCPDFVKVVIISLRGFTL